MIIRTVDGIAFYAKCLLRIEAEIEDETAPFRISKEGIYCFDDGELARAEAWLQEQGVKCEMDKLPAPENWERTVGVKYSSLEEVRAHIEQGIEPKSLLISRLMERLQAVEARAEAAEAKAARIDALEAQLRQG